MSEMNKTSGRKNRATEQSGRTRIENIAIVGEELTEEHLRFVVGGLSCECSSGSKSSGGPTNSSAGGDCSITCD